MTTKQIQGKPERSADAKRQFSMDSGALSVTLVGVTLAALFLGLTHLSARFDRLDAKIDTQIGEVRAEIGEVRSDISDLKTLVIQALARDSITAP